MRNKSARLTVIIFTKKELCRVTHYPQACWAGYANDGYRCSSRCSGERIDSRFSESRNVGSALVLISRGLPPMSCLHGGGKVSQCLGSIKARIM